VIRGWLATDIGATSTRPTFDPLCIGGHTVAARQRDDNSAEWADHRFMLFDEQVFFARRSELDRQAARANAFGAQSDVVRARRSRRRGPMIIKWLRGRRDVRRMSERARATAIATAAEPTP
jgi:hypothetical protein